MSRATNDQFKKQNPLQSVNNLEPHKRRYTRIYKMRIKKSVEIKFMWDAFSPQLKEVKKEHYRISLPRNVYLQPVWSYHSMIRASSTPSLQLQPAIFNYRVIGQYHTITSEQIRNYWMIIANRMNPVDIIVNHSSSSSSAIPNIIYIYVLMMRKQKMKTK